MTTPLLNDDILDGLFMWLPSKCVVLPEIIDSAGIERERSRVEDESNEDKKKEEDRESDITLSGLLNIIDGPFQFSYKASVL